MSNAPARIYLDPVAANICGTERGSDEIEYLRMDIAKALIHALERAGLCLDARGGYPETLKAVRAALALARP